MSSDKFVPWSDNTIGHEAHLQEIKEAREDLGKKGFKFD